MGGYERYGLLFADSIGYRISADDGSSTPFLLEQILDEDFFPF